MRSFLSLAVVVGLACGGGSSSGQMITNLQQNSDPKGSIQGRVTDSATGAGVVGAVITVYAGMTLTATSDATGRYTVGPMAAGSDYDVYVEAPGYVRRIFEVGLDAAAGNYPVGNATVTLDADMSKGDATIDGVVLTNTTHPASGAKIFVDLRGNAYDLLLTATADANGKFTLTGLPGSANGLNVTVNVAPFDENMDGQPDFTATSQSFRMYPGFTTTGTLTLGSVGVTLVESNISDGDLAPTEPITLTFASPIATNQSTWSLRSNNSGLNVGFTQAWDATNTQLTATVVGTLLIGQTYTFNYTVRSTSGAQSSGNISFTVRPSTAATPPGAVANLRVTTPAMMKYDYNTTSVTLAWDVLTDAGGYRVYGKDAAQNPAFVLLQTIANPMTTTQSVSMSSYFGSAGYALNFGNKVTLAVVALDKAGNESPLTMASTVDVSDNTLPTVSFPQQSSSANNSVGATAKVITYSLTFTEPMLQSVTPMVALNNAAVQVAFAWQSTTVGVFTLTVPANIDGSGATMVTGAKDTSGNTIAAYNGTLN